MQISERKYSAHADDGQDIAGLPTEGIEITCFHLVLP